MGWRVVDPIQRVRAGNAQLVVTYEVARTRGFGTPYGFPVYPNTAGYPPPFPRYSQAAFRVIGDGLISYTLAQLQNVIGQEQTNMRGWANRTPPGWRASDFFVVGIGQGLRNENVASVYGVGWTRNSVSFPASEGPQAWVNYVAAAARQNRVNAATGLGAVSFTPVPAFISNAFRLISIEPG